MDAPRRMPTRIALTPAGDITIETVEPDLAEPEPLKAAGFDPKTRRPVTPKFASRLAHAPDYTTLTGQLRIEKGIYELHYAPAGKSDRLGGVVILEMTGDLSLLRDGDLMSVRGQPVVRDRETPAYRPTVIQILERE
jgi:hypothetical protein